MKESIQNPKKPSQYQCVDEASNTHFDLSLSSHNVGSIPQTLLPIWPPSFPTNSSCCWVWKNRQNDLNWLQLHRTQVLPPRRRNKTLIYNITLLCDWTFLASRQCHKGWKEERVWTTYRLRSQIRNHQSRTTVGQVLHNFNKQRKLMIEI